MLIAMRNLHGMPGMAGDLARAAELASFNPEMHATESCATTHYRFIAGDLRTIPFPAASVPDRVLLPPIGI